MNQRAAVGPMFRYRDVSFSAELPDFPDYIVDLNIEPRGQIHERHLTLFLQDKLDLSPERRLGVSSGGAHRALSP